MSALGAIPDKGERPAQAAPVANGPKAVINRIKIPQCSGLLLHRAWLGSERHAGAAARRPGGNVLVADAADQTDCLVGALPSKITVQAGDTRRRLVAPPGILEPARGKIERPSPIRDALPVSFHNDRHRPLCRS